jgi:general nucleoside transport system permease protein
LLKYATPVALAAGGEAVVQKSGVINIGLEGTMLVGAFAGTLVGLATGSAMLGLLAGTVAGVILALIFGGFVVGLAADQVVVGTAINLSAAGLTGTLYRARFGQSGQLLSLPPLPMFWRIDIGMVALVAMIPAVWFLLNRTTYGLVLRSAGEYPKATEAAGYSVSRLRLGAVALGGAIGGLAGAYLSLGVASSFTEGITAGKGFLAIAIVTFGRWRPLWIVAAALLIGFSESLQYRFQSMGIHIPYQLLIAMPYVVALLVLAIVGKGVDSPRALGQPFRRES